MLIQVTKVGYNSVKGKLMNNFLPHGIGKKRAEVEAQHLYFNWTWYIIQANYFQILLFRQTY